MAKVLNGPLVGSITGRLGPVVFAETVFGQVVRSKQRTVIHHSPAAIASKRAMRNAHAGYAKSGEVLQLTLRVLARRFGTTPSAMVIGPFIKALYNGEAKPRWSDGFNLVIEWGAPYFAGGRWRVPYTAPVGNDPFDHALVIPVRDPLERDFGAIFSPFGVQEFWLPTTASQPDATPPFVILASTTVTVGSIPPEPQVTQFSGFAALLVP